MLMIVPLPPLLLDLLLSIDIGLSVVLLLTVVYVKKPVEFSVFPSLLLLLTLLRLALNVAATRLILLHGHEGVDAAGHVIMAFGQFVVGGNFVVGIVVFLVLIAIQFIVINHGAVRISEVTARFTLDAMPGQQMAIDADLNAGVIDEAEARTRRDRVRREADFYGSMDGAIRFTQRDALAAILITVVNIVAGLIIGVLQHGVDLATAAQTYTILTIGEGLVTAIPALLVSMSGGLITTRAASESHLGDDVADQLLARWRPLAVAAAALVALALIPGLPKFAFITVALALGGAAYATRRAAAAAVPAPAAPPAAPDALDGRREHRPARRRGRLRAGLARGREAGRHAAGAHPLDPPADRHRDRRRRAAGARGRQPPARAARLHDSRQGRRGGARRALRRPAAGHQSRARRRRPRRASQTRSRRSACRRSGSASSSATAPRPPATPWSIRRRRCRRTCPRRSASFLPDLLTRQQTKELVDRVAQTSPKLVEELVPKIARSATSSACSGSCCASACRSAT